MKIVVTRSGGFAGMRRTWEVRLEDQADRREWMTLLRQLPWDERPPTPPAPDRFVYLIRVSRRTITLPEQQLDGHWRDLVDRVRSAADSAAPRTDPDDGRLPHP